MLADLCFRRMMEAERRGRPEEMASYRTLVESYHEGKYARQLQGDGSLRLDSDPDGAHVYIASYVEHGGRLVPENERYVGITPTDRLSLPMGSYVATIRLEGYPDVSYPFLVGRNEDVVARVALLAAGELPGGFVYVAAGPFLRGGQRVGVNALERCEIPGFCIARNPVTMVEYLEFINDVAASSGMEAALRHVPRSYASTGHYFTWDGQRFAIPQVDADGDPWDPGWPVMSVSAVDADAYAEWRSRRDGLPLRLPTSDEWEKAARGVDGRSYPWGNRWDDQFSHSLSEGSIHGPEPVGRPSDVGPYGVLGMAGNVQDWTATAGEETSTFRVIRGGGFEHAYATAMLGLLHHRRPEAVSSDTGFRLAFTPARLLGR
jgi:serine/threonine-protein kinase